MNTPVSPSSEVLEKLQALRHSVNGDCYNGKEWELETIDAIRAALAERAQQEALTPAQAGEAFVRSLGLGLWPDHRHCYEMGYSDALAARPTSAANSTAPMQPSDREPMQCEDCNGTGEVGEEVYQGEFQPPERGRCDSCNGSGWWMVDATPNQDEPAQPSDEAEAFEQLCREHEIAGTAVARLCEVFWSAGGRFALAAPTQAPMQPSDVPEGCTPADARMLRAANHGLAAENDRLRKALEFYAEGSHFTLHQPDAWETVSGEPQNFYEDESSTATVEDGSVAKMALAGTPLPDDEPCAAKTAEGRKPFTDEQIENLRGEANRGFNIEREDYFKAFRDAESAHGIGDQP